MPWTALAWPILTGLALSLALEPAVQPRPLPLWRRPLAATVIHVALWLLLFCFELAVFHRPWFAMAIVLAFQLFVVLVNNAKFHSLREPFIFQDFEYFLDALKHPRLYLPFLGTARAVIAVAGFGVAFYGGLHFEPALSASLPLADFFGMVAALAVFAGALLWCGARRPLPVSFAPQEDLRALGLLASLWCYAREERRHHPLPAARPAAPAAESAALPHLVVVQSESFFDARRLFAGIRPEVLQTFDALQAAAVRQGRVEVAAWGANTVRTEFAFLSGLDASALGVHRFNPYRKLARQGVPTLAGLLRQQGYRTVCVHPYHASFYTRHEVYPLMGFDEFIDIEHFRDVEKTGPYVGDAALAEKVCALLQQQASDQPLFVFVISMENHGPLHLEKVSPGDEERLYSAPPPAGCDDLTIYLRHLANADRMAGMLRDQLQSMARPGWLCWYGDHVPIMPRVYSALSEPDGRTDWFLWRNGDVPGSGERVDLRIEDLSDLVLEEMGLKSPSV
ncbi:LTA synthase family protein [Comamonas endophytica]|uniref:LTA synthase family protein n=1 Tax=Comamonas endophytica TaxID=2949090 RepID=A0ABY6GE78_9BURK|nr:MULTISPECIES: LTA synthase family protein [unclassified Acidovorax]MCD2512433.1 LTA synthase family protein [Acidovorax sp. D4N7]UYG53196.1 LTA synthase family protein [Acidovorax sp. 5MLIR]